MEIRISEISRDDIPSCAELIRKSFKTVADEFGLTRDNSPTNGAFLEDGRLREEYERGVKMFGSFENDTQTGFMALERKDGHVFYLEKLSVLPEHRHRGHGRLLMDHAREYVKSLGGKKISIGIIYENKLLLKWYEDYGFAATGTKKFEHLPFIVCFMELEI